MTEGTQRASMIDEASLFGPGARRSPEMEAVWAWILEHDAGAPDWLGLSAGEAREVLDRSTVKWNVDLPAMAEVRAVTLAGRPDVPGRLFVPRDARPGCILYLHGGGWHFGSIASHERLMRLIALDTGTRVLGVDYRLAPEHPFPAPFEDSLTAWRALVAMGGEPGFDGPLAIAGDSAGANLATAVILHTIETSGRRPDLGLLFYGVFDADLDSPSYRRFSEGFGLTRTAMRRFWDWYAPAERRRHPLVSPVAAPDADLARMPPLYLNAAGLDPLLSDTLAFARRLEAAGTPHALAVHEGVHHGFMQMSLRLPEARTAIRRAASFYEDVAHPAAAARWSSRRT